ncbi:MAG: hypothetical protein KDK29_15610 [Sedimentitalea sp.]|nr:hypothetical protein [Sedimentitalea sp.]
MTIEIGSLVVRGTFGRPQDARAGSAEASEERLRQWRREILDEVREMMAEAERLARER